MSYPFDSSRHKKVRNWGVSISLCSRSRSWTTGLIKVDWPNCGGTFPTSRSAVTG